VVSSGGRRHAHAAAVDLCPQGGSVCCPPCIGIPPRGGGVVDNQGTLSGGGGREVHGVTMAVWAVGGGSGGAQRQVGGYQ
jgi:hypothetical protein